MSFISGHIRHKNTVRHSFVISFCRPQFWFQWLLKLLFLVCKSLRLAGECLSFPLSHFLATHPVCRSIFFSWTLLHCTVLILTLHSDFSSCSLIIFPFPVISRWASLRASCGFFLRSYFRWPYTSIVLCLQLPKGHGCPTFNSYSTCLNPSVLYFFFLSDETPILTSLVWLMVYFALSLVFKPRCRLHFLLRVFSVPKSVNSSFSEFEKEDLHFPASNHSLSFALISG